MSVFGGQRWLLVKGPNAEKFSTRLLLRVQKQPVSPESIFSEGERTAISLAFYLADLGSVQDTCGVIFDDPVTSLDHRIREGVVNALVTEAKDRQVIVFTHDLAFYCELMSANYRSS